MNRMDAILAGFTSIAVLTICFVTYQILKDPEAKVAKIQPTRLVTTPLVTPDGTKTIRSQQVRKYARKLNPAIASFSDLRENLNPPKPMLIGTTASEPTIKQRLSAEDAKTLESLPKFTDIHFDFNAGGLPEAAQTRLQGYADFLKSSQWDVLIKGHTDHRGSTGFNLRVGRKRADAVKEYLGSLDVPKGRMHVVSLGEFDLACKQDTEACANINRRVQFSLIKRDTEREQAKNIDRKAMKEKEDRMKVQGPDDELEKDEGSSS
jgi:peptidoglycan-associated lipoprotein